MLVHSITKKLLVTFTRVETDISYFYKQTEWTLIRGIKFHSARIGELTSGSSEWNTCQARPYGRVHFPTCKMHFIL